MKRDIMREKMKSYSSQTKSRGTSTPTFKRRIRAGIFSLVLLFVCGTPSFAQNELNDLIRYALDHSHDVKKAALKQEEAMYQYRETRSKGLPQLEGKGSYSLMKLGGITSSLEGLSGMVPEDQAAQIGAMLSELDNIYSTSVGIQATQLIYSQAYWTGLKLAKKSEELYDILKEKSDEDVIAEVCDNYYQAGSLLMQLSSLNKSKANLEELYKLMELLYKNDMITEPEVSRVKVGIVNLETSIRTIKNAIEIQKNYIKALTGMPSDSTVTIDTTAIASTIIVKQESGFDINNISAYQALLKQDEIYEGQVKSAQAELYPTLAAYAQLNYSSYGTKSKPEDLSNMSTIGLNLSIPIFSSGANRNKIKQYKIQRAQLQEDIQKNQQLLSIDYANAVSDYKTASELLAVQKDNCDLANRVYHQTFLQYQEGMASLADLLNVNNDYLKADNAYNQQIIKLKTAEVKMLKASGAIKQLINN